MQGQHRSAGKRRREEAEEGAWTQPLGRAAAAAPGLPAGNKAALMQALNAKYSSKAARSVTRRNQAELQVRGVAAGG